jgi:hypothetical protein
MPAVAGQAIHVNGPALVLVGPQGLNGALSPLGYTEEGVDLAINNHDDPVVVDDAGTQVPADLQDMGRDASFELRLPKYDDKWLRWVLERRSQQEGQDNVPGGLIFGGNRGFRLVIDSPNEDPYRFYFCTLRNSSSSRLSTRRNLWSLSVYAIRGYLTGRGNYSLFDRVKG